MKSNIMKWLLAILVIKAYLLAAPANSIYSDRAPMSVDDIVTVLVMESAKAGSESGTNTNKKNTVGAQGMNGTGALSWLPNFGVSAGTELGYDGKGSTSREGSLVAKISARVVKVLDNGNLVIDGSKVVEINNEKEIIQVAGTIRPKDIGQNNTIYSYNISDAKITYSGKGTATTGQRPGLLARFLNWIF